MDGRVISLLAAVLWASITMSGEQVAVDNAPRIITNNGNLMFQTGNLKTIHFETQGNGEIKFNDIEIREFYGQMRDIRAFINSNRNTNNQCDCNAMKLTIASSTQKIQNLKNKLKRTIEQMNTISTLTNELQRISTIDECANNPCHNGGICIDGFNKYKCLCKEQYKGINCMEDVDECTQLAGTDLGCQNNARCENIFGGFRCICSGKWAGVLCNTPQNGCTGSSNIELCGHGMCIPDHATGNPRSFKCICDHGWNLDALTNTCIADIDECQTGRYPCSEVPLVPCNNSPGSFSCGQCPNGYDGNGFSCLDVNECLNPSACGVNEVCINLLGSYKCQCVEGMTYNQNGICQRQNICLFNNGGCNINAQCTQSAYNIEGRICSCITGYIGNGIGSNGCVVSPSINTTNSQFRECVRLQLCHNGGTCQVTETGFTCICAPSFTGPHCLTQIINRCLQNPCLNGGTCTPMETNNYMCTCTTYFTGRNCETEHNECGGSIISPRNSRQINFLTSLSSSVQFYRYPCIWTVLVSEEEFIQVKPINITRQWSGTCAVEYVQILEKSTSDGAPRELAKFCRDNPYTGPNAYNTTGPILIIKAQFLNNAQIRGGFSVGITPFNYVMQNLDCCRCQDGQHVITDGSEGIFSSPHYPLNYPDGIDCVMQYERIFGHRYRTAISILNLDLGDSNGNCSDTDYLKIMYVERGETKVTACNQGTYQNQRFITSGFKIHFHSDSITGQNPSRFRISWRQVLNQDPCGGIINFQNSATINGPALSENQEAYCTWIVHQSNTSQMISLKGFFTNWQNGDCSVYIRVLSMDLHGTTTILYNQCQSTVMLDELLEQVTGQLIIIFRKPLGISTPGFRIQATYICGKIIDMDSLTSYELLSPDYPNNYNNDLSCIYKFVARTRKFSVDFVDFDVTDDYPCTSDYISIQGASKSFSNRKFCNGNLDYLIPIDKYPSEESLIINFRTNSSVNGRGFKALVTLLDCGGSYYLSSRLVIAYPESHINDSSIDTVYEHNRKCVWNIVSPPGSYMLTIFDHFHLEHHYNCRYDWLAVTYDNVTDRRFCGNDVPNIVTRSNRLKLVFQSDYSVSGEGFIMRLYLGSLDTHCHQDVISPEGSILSPPIRSMPRPYFCKYSITVPQGRKVVIEITIEGSTEGNYTSYSAYTCYGKGRLRIKNGNLGSATLTQICPESPQRSPIITSANKATIVYFVPAYRSTNEFNFTIMFHSIDEECGSIHTDDNGEIASVNYPLYAPRNTYCQWELHSTPGRQTVIKVIHIRAGHNSETRQCDDSKRPVIRLVSLSQEISLSCERHAEEIYRFNDRVVRVIFKNFENTQYRFRLLYRKECIFTTNSSFGRIESNNLITGYPNYCSWTINILRGSPLSFQLDEFDLPNQVDGICRAYVRITDKRGVLLNNACGSSLINNTFESSYSPITIRHFIRRGMPLNVLQAHRGFTLEYNTHGCIYNIEYDPNSQSYYQVSQNKKGSISSPQYPNSVSNQDCIWKFKTVLGYSIKLTFDVIELDHFQNCSQGYVLKARESDSVDEPYVFRACDRVQLSTSPLIFQSSTHYLNLEFFSANDDNGGHRKFHANYEFINASCEYQLTATEGFIKSPNYPLNYPPNINCKWELSVRQGMSIHLHFLDLNIEGSSCRYDYVQLFSQLNAEMRPMIRLCGNEFNTSQLYESFDNKMLVTFKTDFSVQRRGFKARFFEGCGGLRNASELTQFLVSPNYPHPYNLLDDVCEWTITANISKPGERIFFYFYGFEGDSSDQNQNCSLTPNTILDNSLTIVDGLEDSPVKAVLCSHRPSPPIISTGHFLRVILKSTNGRSIFRAGFGTGSSACGGEYFLDDGILTSPFYPNSVNLDMDCVYVIKNNPGSEVHLTIEEFTRTNSNSYLMHDYLEIRVGNSLDNSTLFGRYYTLLEIQNVTANVRFNNTIILRFRSQGGDYTNAIKFLARYHINYQSEFQSDEGLFASPQFGHLYKADTSQTWIISPFTVQSIDIEFLNFSVGQQLQNGFCDRGKLTIIDGNRNTKIFCGSNLPVKDTYSVPVTITLNAQGYRYDGFILKWSVTKNESHTMIGPCKYVIQASTFPQILTSPNFPNFDPINRDCEWTIVAPKGRALDLQILNFTMENSRNCKYENFTITLQQKYYSRNWNMFQRISYRYTTRTFCGTQETSLLNFTKNIIFNKVTINFKVDDADIFPGFQLQYKLRCFRELNSLQGWLQNDEFPNYMTEFKNCTYVLQIPGNRFYQINVTSLNLPPETNNQCSDGHLEVYTTRRIGRYCGSNIPSILSPLLTNSSTVYLNLVGSFDRYPTYSGFQLKYSLMELEDCGSTYILSRNTDEIIITNPRNDSIAPHFIECKWFIKSPYGTRMKIDFLSLLIYSQPNCVNSFLALYDGSTTLSKKIGDKNYCSKESSVFTSDNRLLVLFKNFDAYAAFNIRISVGICGGNLYRESGIITSPNYPNFYPKQTMCVWTIKSIRSHSVSIQFNDMYPNSDCTKSNLTIYSVDNPSRFNWSSCVDSISTIHVMSNVVQIIFNTNPATSGRGFKLSYRSRYMNCGGRLTEPSDEVKSMNYPATLPNDVACVWRIEADVSKRVTIKILNLTLRQSCIRIYDERNIRIALLCNRNFENYEIDTKSSIASIYLYSDGESRILFSYHTDLPSFCGSHIYSGSNDTGLIAFDGNSTISYCHHIVHNYPGDTGTLVFKVKNDTGLNCHRNKINFVSKVYEAIGTDEIIDNLDFCSATERNKIIFTTMGKLVDVTYTSNRYYNESNQTIVLAYKYQRCGGILTDSYGSISSPNYPNRYPHNSNCEWIIMTQPNMHIKLVIQTLHLEYHAFCGYDYLYIRSGPEFDSPPVNSFCGRRNVTNETLIFRHNRLRLSFKSDYSAAEVGFLLQYNVINAVDNCNGFIFNTTGSIKSPNYPLRYPSNINCNWTIIIPKGYRIEMTVQDPFDLEQAYNGQCPYDALDVYDSHPSVIIARLCGHVPNPRTIMSSENRLGLHFTTDYNLNLDGFRVTYRSLCGGTFNGTYGLIVSPTVFIYTGNYLLQCQYIVPAWKNHLTVLSILPSLNLCQYYYGYVEIWKEILPGRYMFSQNICGKSSQPVNVFNALSIMIKYNVTYRGVQRYSFKAKYLHDETVIVYRNFTRKIQIKTPLFPTPYHHNADLQWKFEAPPNYVFYIEILNMDIEYSSLGCIYDYIAFYRDNTTNSSSLVNKLCGLQTRLIPFKIDSNVITIHFISDSSHYANHTGFTASILSTPGPQLGCGGELILEPNSMGSIASVDLNNDGRYENGLLCVWNFFAPIGFVIHGRFENNSVALERRSRLLCHYDWIRIHDGPFPSSQIIYHLCGNDSVDPFTSSGSTLLVQFQTDNSITNRGFRMFYSIIRSLNNVYLNATSTFQILTSPGYPDSTNYNFKSQIEISAPNESDHILVEIKELSIRPTSNCSLDSFLIKDVSLRNVNQLRKICKSIENPVTFISSDNKVVATYQIGAQEYMSRTQELRYKIEYKIYSCNRTETAYSGRIINIETLKQRSYSHNTLCNLTLEAPSTDLKYQFYFKKLMLENSGTCAYDYIQFIYGRPTEQQYTTPKICGSELPPSFVSNSSFVTMTFVSDSSVSLEGFDITYVVNRDPLQKCGGEIDLDSGVVTSPGFGRNIYEIGQCTWDIASVSRKAISWKITDLQLQGNMSLGQACDTAMDYVQVTNNGTIKRFCGNIPPTQEFQAVTGQIKVEYKSINGGTGVGFRLEWNTVVLSSAYGIVPSV